MVEDGEIKFSMLYDGDKEMFVKDGGDGIWSFVLHNRTIEMTEEEWKVLSYAYMIYEVEEEAVCAD